MKIVAISDTHGSTPYIEPGADILTISGDITPCYNVNQGIWFKEEFLPWASKQARSIVFIAGNHDKFLYQFYRHDAEQRVRDVLPENVHYLRDSGVEIEGVKIWGTPWTPEFCDWYFMDGDTEGQLGKHYSKIPEGLDILLCHGPAYGHNDRIEEPAYEDTPLVHIGSHALLHHVRRASPKKLLVGHIHSGSHAISYIASNAVEMTASTNVSILDERYKPYYSTFDVRGL